MKTATNHVMPLLGTLLGTNRPVKYQSPVQTATVGTLLGAGLGVLPMAAWSFVSNDSANLRKRKLLVGALMGAVAAGYPAYQVAKSIHREQQLVPAAPAKKTASAGWDPLASDLAYQHAVAQVVSNDMVPFSDKVNQVMALGRATELAKQSQSSIFATAAKIAVGAFIGNQLAGWVGGVFGKNYTPAAQTAGLLGGAYVGYRL